MRQKLKATKILIQNDKRFWFAAAFVCAVFFVWVMTDNQRTHRGNFFVQGSFREQNMLHASQDFVNLISTYEAETARRQYLAAQKYFPDSAESQNEGNTLNSILEVIEQSNQSQFFVYEPALISFFPSGKDNSELVAIGGCQHRFLNGKADGDVDVFYLLKIRNSGTDKNPYGIEISDFQVREIK